MDCIQPCSDRERMGALAIINDAATAYRGVIPPDCWHEPYMTRTELEQDVADGVEFWGYEAAGELVGVMGIQRFRDVDLIRHAYVLPSAQRTGVGSSLIEHITELSDRPMLVGTWRAATWAITFYERHGFELLSPDVTPDLLRRYWRIPDRQIETSVVLASPGGTPVPVLQRAETAAD